MEGGRLQIKDDTGDGPVILEFFELEELQEIQCSFVKATGISSSVCTPEGKLITEPSVLCYSCNCDKNTSLPDCYTQREKYDSDTGKPVIYYCPKSHFYSAVLKISLGGNHIANWYVGPVVGEQITGQEAHGIAENMGDAGEAYLEAYKTLPVVSRERFEEILDFFHQMIKLMNQNALMRLGTLENEEVFDTSIQKNLYRESNFYDIFQTVKDGVAYTSLTGKVLMVNDALQMMLGLPRSEIVGKSFIKLARELLTDEYLKLALPNLKGLLQGKDFRNFVFEYKDQILEISARVNLKTRRMTGVVRDITEQVYTEKVLRQSEERFRKAFFTSPDAININRARDGLYVSINRGFTILTGFAEEEVIGLTSTEINIWANSEERDRLMFALKNKGFAENHEADFRLKNGQIKRGLISASIIELDNEPHIISITRDIHERVQIMEELKNAKEKAEESDKLKSAFLANMSHEIRTPMNGIMGFADLLKNPELTGEKQQHYIDIIEKSGIRMLNIINDLIDISKIEAGQVDLHIQEFNVLDIMNEVVRFFRPEAEKKNISLKYSEDKYGNRLILRSDKDKLYAILTNLIKNGIKFCKEGYVELGLKKINERVEFYIKDTGPGIPPDKIDKIFDRFVQADPLDEASQQGAGLGLAISKAYIDMLGGTIYVSSSLGNGTEFVFDIPGIVGNEHLVKQNNADGNVMNALANKELTFLIVEDDSVSFTFLSVLLEGVKEIIPAESGKEALRICHENEGIDIILMDIGLPEVDGYTVTRQIREFNKDVIIIAQTAYGMDGDRERAIESGCNDYISKPIRKEEFYSLINSFFPGNS